MKRFYRYLIIAFVMILATLACNLGASRVEPASTPSPIPTQSIEDLRQGIEKAIEDAQRGAEVKLEINEQELTALVASGIQAQDETPVQDPQVLLRDGQISFLATVERQNIALPAEVVMTVQPDSQGKPDFDVLSATIGPLPLPGNVKSDLEAALDKTFAAEIEARSPNTHIERIVIADGLMTITGKSR